MLSPRPLPPSNLVSRNITVSGHRTSVRLEPEMWNGMRDICRREKLTMHQVCSFVAEAKPSNSSLTAAIRVFIMAYFRAAATEDGHNKAGHGPGGTTFMPAIIPLQANYRYDTVMRR
jgi:predicted DNA-binding ribbon-helix-helix protein